VIFIMLSCLLKSSWMEQSIDSSTNDVMWNEIHTQGSLGMNFSGNDFLISTIYYFIIIFNYF